VTTYAYSEAVQREVERAIRDAIPGRVRLERASLGDDLGGVDLHYRINGACDLQVRCRFDRPAYAADCDVTFRDTEPRMIANRTYAPLMLFLWFRGDYYEAGKLVDVYRMHDRLEPPLADRSFRENSNGDHAWCAVTISELHDAGALLRQGGRDGWAAACLQGNERVHRIIEGRH
jgi:hypothetical protein